MFNIKNIALIYDNQKDQNKYGYYCHRALETLCSVTHFLPADIDNIPQNAYDLYLNIDDSLRYILPVYLKPSVWLVMDNNNQIDWSFEKGRMFDIVFTAQRSDVERFEKGGIKKAVWLPLGIVPELDIFQDRMKVLLEISEKALSDIYNNGMRGYYHTPRPELLSFISPHIKNVLEIGCGAGVLGESIKRKSNAVVTGIEILREAADEAMNRLDKVIIGDCEELNYPDLFKRESFDCLILGDVIEHLRNPLQFLQNILPFLTKNAEIIASIPNVQNISILTELVKGNWTYMDYGILDKTHLRFFTRKEIQKLFYAAGFSIDTIQGKFDSTYHRWVNQGKPAQFTSGALMCGPLPEVEIRDFFVYQFLIKANKIDNGHTVLR